MAETESEGALRGYILSLKMKQKPDVLFVTKAIIHSGNAKYFCHSQSCLCVRHGCIAVCV